PNFDDMRSTQTADGIMDGKDVLLGRFVSQRPYVAHLMAGANAMCESFFATLECELLERHRSQTQVEARMAVFDFIEGSVNPCRGHSALGYLTPITGFYAGSERSGEKKPVGLMGLS